MVIGSSEAMKVFICYAPEDELLLNIYVETKMVFTLLSFL